MTAPIAAGYIPLGIAYGILVMQLGMPWWMAPALSIAAFSGSAELLVITLAASYTPIAVIAVTMLLVNFRHLFYAFSFPLHLVEGRFARLFSMYALVDEAYAITAARPEGWTKPRLLAMQVTYHVTWVASGLVGVLAGSFIPAQIQGLDFALTALFITLTVDSIRSLKDIPSVVLAAGSFLIAMLIWPKQKLLLALLLFVASLVVRHVFSRVRERISDLGADCSSDSQPAANGLSAPDTRSTCDSPSPSDSLSASGSDHDDQAHAPHTGEEA